MEDLIIKILSNIWYALIALVILTVILHLFLVYPKNLSKKQWKKVDYVWISLTAIGLLGATNNVELILSKSRVGMASQRLPFRYQYLMSFLQPDGSPIVCRSFVKNNYSPDNYDEVVEDFNQSCKWSKKVYEVVSKIDTNDYRRIDTTQIAGFETKHNQWYRGVIMDNLRQYNELVQEKEESERRIHNASNTNTLFFAPLLLIIGLAIRITKVSGELRHEKG